MFDGKPNYPSWDEKNLGSNSYNANSVVYACTRKITQSFSSVPLIAEKRTGGGVWEAAPDSLPQQLISRPNPFDTESSLKEKIALHLIIYGNAFWTKIRTDSRDKTTYNLWPHMPSNIAPVRSNNMWISQYEFKPPRKEADLIACEDILHFLEVNPDDFMYGISRIQVIKKLIQTSQEQLDFQNASMSNRGVLSGILTHEGNPSKPQFKAARDKIEQDLKGTRNARRIIQTSNKIDWQQIGFTPHELDFIESRKEGFREIAIAMGVPFILLGLEGSTFNNIAEAKKTFWEDTILPMSSYVADLINCHLMPEFTEREYGKPVEYRVRFDYSGVKALQEDFHKKVKSAVSLIKCDVFDALSISRVMDLGFTEDDLKKAGQDTPQLPESTNDEIIQELAQLLALPASKSRQAIQHKAFDDDRKRYEARARQRISNLFGGELELILDAFDNEDDLEEALPKILEALDDNDDSWLELFNTIYETGIDFFARSEYNRGEKEIKSFSYNRKAYEGLNNTVRNFINRVVAQRVSGIRQTTREALTVLVLEAQSRGLSTEVVREAIRQRYAQFQDSRSKLISETEHSTISNHGSSYGAEVLADDNEQQLFKTWVTQGDDLVRESHVEVNGQTIPYGEVFDNGLFEPGDEDAPIAEVANCRCRLEYSYRN